MLITRNYENFDMLQKYLVDLIQRRAVFFQWISDSSVRKTLDTKISRFWTLKLNRIFPTVWPFG